MYVAPQTFTSSSDRFAHNLAALHVLAAVEQEQRLPSAQEHTTLANFTSFGESALLTRLLQHVEAGRVTTLTADDVASLRRAALTAFYTPLDVAGVIWEALEQLGIGSLPTLRVLEPAAGVGNLLAAMPQDLRARALITAVELEPVSARIFRQLHPDCTLHAGVGFQDVLLPDNVFDLAFSNVPFGDFGVADATLPVNERFLASRIHDYFLAKMLRVVRPGGIVAALTSYGTLDKHTTRVRQWIAERADLLAAYRLPSGLFATNAGSQAGADLLILQKHPAGGIEASDWREVTPIEVTPWTMGGLHTTSGARYGDEHDEVHVNQYFADRPHHIIGTPYEIRHHGYLFYSVQPPTDSDLASALRQRIEATLPRHVVTDAPQAVPTRMPTARKYDAPALRLDDIAGAHQLRATALAAVYRAAKALIQCELDTSTDDATLDTERQALNAAYDTFVDDYGIVNSPTNKRIFQHLPELPFLQALEDQPRCIGGGWIAAKAPLFTRRTLRALPSVVEGSLSVQDALIRSLDTTGTVDMHLIVRLSGQSADAVRAALVGVIFRTLDLTTEAYETADAFLSGNVRVKLRQAQALAALNPTFAAHVAALETVQPTMLGPEAIIVRLGAVWVPAEDITAFVQHLIPSYRGKVTFRDLDASWRVQSTDTARTAVANTATWGTPRMDALDLVEALLNSRPIIVRDTVEHADGSTSTVVNDTETAAAQEKADAVRGAFTQWIWSDPTRTQRLVTIYNERFNALRPRVYDGSHLSLPGLNTAVLRDGDLSEWQKAAVWQGLQQPATLLAHAVGAGKTYTMITIAREARRMGLAAKPCMLVPNHLVGQTARAAQQLFPGLAVLALGEQDFARDRRGVALSRIATGDWDLVVVPFSSFQFLPVDESVLDTFYDGERQRLREALEAAQDAARTATDTRAARSGVKRIEKALERLEVRLKNTLHRIARDSEHTITWRELGIDLLMVDEAHCFPYDTPVLTDRGWLPIGKIVDERLPVTVQSCDVTTGELVWKPITGWFNNPVTAPLVRVEHVYGDFVCTANHKIWTEEEGYVAAGALQDHHHLYVLRKTIPGVATRETEADILLADVCPCLPAGAAPCHQAVCAVWADLHVPLNGGAQQRETTLLQHPLCSDVAHGTARTQGALRPSGCTFPWGCRAREEESSGSSTHADAQSDARSTNAREGASSAHGADVSGAGWQWEADHTPTAACRGHRISDGVCDCNCTRCRSVSIAATCLQSGPSRSESQAGDRGGWENASSQEMAVSGPAQDRGLTRARVVGVTVLESADTGGSTSGAGNHSRVYCLEVADTHTFFAAGVLVSNCFKNLYVPSRLTVAGAPQADSLRALDLRIKTWEMLRQGQKVIFATATPIMNTLGEAFVMQLYLQEQELAQMGIDTFDAWVSVFAEVRDLCELKPDGSGFQVKSRLNTFINLPELAQLWSTVLNVRTAEQLALPRPDLVGDKPVIVAVPSSPALEQLTRQFVARVERIKLRQVDPTIDNMLKVTSDARLAALDPRLLVGGEEAPQSKLIALADRVAHLYHTYQQARGTQIVFCDLATPKGKRTTDVPPTDEAAPPTDDTTALEQTLAGGVYHAIRAKLVARGIPAAEVAFIHDYHTNAARDALFAATNAGTIRVLIGSTAKMGTGMNVQQRLIALHQLDAPWRPGDVEQRNGRILRQGNRWPDVYVFHYVTEGSFDSYLWQLLENKARFIAQVITGEVTARSADDVGDTVLTAAEVKAIASGNPRVFEHFALQNQCAKLERVRRSWNETRHALARKRAVRVEAIATRQARSAELAQAQQIYTVHADEDFTLTLATSVDTDERRTYTNRDEAGTALERLARHTQAAAASQHRTIHCAVGTYRGFTVVLHAWPFTLRAVELRLVYEQASSQITALERALDEDLTARGIISSLDASLRDLGARIVRNARLDAEDTQQIAAADAELERTAVWEHAERYAHLHERLQALTAELRAATDVPTTAPQISTNMAGETPLPVDAAAVTDAAEETVLPAEDSVPAEARAAAFVVEDIPPAPRSLALLQALPAPPAPVVLGADAAPTCTALTPSPRPQSTSAASSTPDTHAPRFGDHALLRQQRRAATTSSSQPASAPVADTPTQLDLFAA